MAVFGPTLACSPAAKDSDTTGGVGGSAASGAGTGATMGGGAPGGSAGASSGGASGTAAGLGGGGGVGAGAGGVGAAGGSAGSVGGFGGAAGLGGGAGDGGASGTGAAGTSGDAGGGAGGAAGASGSAGDAGMAGSAGAGGGSGLHGGASGAFVCAPGATYGDPLAGMGAVTVIGPPTMGTPNYFAFLEGPVWIASLQTLFFSDNASQPAETIWQLVPATSMVPSVFQAQSYSNGLALDGDDQLIITDEVNNRITRLDPTSSAPMQTLIVAAGCKPNDIVVRSDGNIYYTAPNGQGTGFYRIDPNGAVTGPRTDVGAPNGIVLSPDEATLYVDDVQNMKIASFAVASDGTVSATATPFVTTVSSTADGMCVDCAGNLYVGTSNGVEVFSPTGSPIGVVPTGYSSNCTFGGPDRKTLYATSQGQLKAVTLGVPGLPD